MLDIGTGSGALAVSIALARPKAHVTAVDVSVDALCVARENARALGVDVRMAQSDLFAALPGERFDVIVSNPPYIETGELEGLQREVRREPRLALDGGADGLDFYRRIVRELPAHLMPGGTALFEVGLWPGAGRGSAAEADRRRAVCAPRSVRRGARRGRSVYEVTGEAMLERLDWVKGRYEELSMLLSQPEVVADQARWQRLLREHAQLEPLFQACGRYEQLLAQRREADEMLRDPDLADMAQEEIESLSAQIEDKEREIQLLLLPRDPNDERNVVMEIRAGAGGEEAGLFGAVLLRMYTRYAERRGLRVEMMDGNFTELGGVKEATFTISGAGAYSRLKYESGVHRVQRVPATESGGRIHTSTATVAVLPEAEEVEVQITLRTCASTSTAPAGTAASASIRRIRRCASPTCRRGWWSPARTRSRRSRTGTRPCAYCARDCMTSCAPSGTRRMPRTARRRWARAIGASASVRTTFRRGA